MLLDLAGVTKVWAMSRPRSLLLLVFMMGFVGLLAACSGRPKYPSCDGDSDCKPPEKCVNKKCAQCRDDMDCKEGTACSVAHTCEPVAGYCTSDAQCGVFEVCKDHKCSSCVVDSECGPGGTCRAGKCIRPGACENDNDCPEDQDCIDNRCTKFGSGTTINIPKCPLDPVYFGFDVYTLADDAKNILSKNYDCLQANKDRRVSVAGHTDSRGTIEYNISLSDDRAQAVITYLSRLGVDPARLRKVPKGSGEATGVEESGFAKDRRVDFTWE